MDEIDNIILKRLNERKSQREIARELNKSDSFISIRIKKMKNNGIEIPKLKSKKLDDKILQGLAQGKTVDEIANELEFTKEYILYRIRRMNNPDNVRTETKKRSEEINKIILEELAKGETLREVSEKTGKSITNISKRINKMKEQGIEVIRFKRHKKRENDEKDEEIWKRLEAGEKPINIAKDLGLSRQRVSQRLKQMEKRENQKLAKIIADLMLKKHATIEQVKTICEYYGVDIDRALSSLYEKDR